jgi:Tfp pilus assembly protein PilO
MRLEGRSLVAQIERHRTSLALVAVVGLCLLLVYWFWLDPVLSKKKELSESIAQQQAMIQKYQEKLAQGTALKESLTKQEQELGRLQRKVFHGEDSYQLAAKLGDIVSAKGSQDLNVKSYQVLASKEHGVYQEVQLKFDFTATIAGVYTFLNGIQKSPTAIQVQQMRVQKVQRKTGHDLVISVVLTALMEISKKP